MWQLTSLERWNVSNISLELVLNGVNLCSQVENKFAASQAYGLDKSRFHFFDSAFDLVLGLASNLLGWMPWLWDVSTGLVTKAGLEGWGGDIPTSLTFVVLAMITQAGFALHYALCT